MMWSKGYAADETKAAFGRAQELLVGVNDLPERLKIYYGMWAASLTPADFASAHETAEIYRREAENGARAIEVSSAHVMLGHISLFKGDFLEARAHFERGRTVLKPNSTPGAGFSGIDPSCMPLTFLSLINWLLGDLGRARELNDEAVARATESDQALSLAHTYRYKVLSDIFSGCVEAAQRSAEVVARFAREHGAALYLAAATFQIKWARARLGDGDETITTELQNTISALSEEENKLWVPLFQGLLAELQADCQNATAALTRIDEALALAGETGEHWTDAFLHRIRGEILLKRDLANTMSAEKAFLTATSISKQQKARSFELRAALSLAKLYRSTGRAADAHSVLGPALEGFSATPEFPEIEEAQKLLAALS